MSRNFLDFTLRLLLLYKRRNLFIFMLLSVVIFLAASVLFVASSIKSELLSANEELPQIILQKRIATKLVPISLDVIPKLVTIDGIEAITPRLWGIYQASNLNTSFSIVGIDRFDYLYTPLLQEGAKMLRSSYKEGEMIVGKGVYEILKSRYYKEYFNFLLQDGTIKRMHIIGVLTSKSALLNSDMMLMPPSDARAILGIPKGYASDLALHIPNKEEVDTIASKLKLLDPSYHIITKEERARRYAKMFDYRGGIFLLLFLIILASLFMIVSERLGALGANERKEIAILKALGWSIRDIIKERFVEAFIIATLAYMFAILLALLYVYPLGAPLLIDLFSGTLDSSRITLSYTLSLSDYLLIFLTIIPLYLAAVILPAWRIATEEIDEVIR